MIDPRVERHLATAIGIAEIETQNESPRHRVHPLLLVTFAFLLIGPVGKIEFAELGRKSESWTSKHGVDLWRRAAARLQVFPKLLSRKLPMSLYIDDVLLHVGQPLEESAGGGNLKAQR